MPTPEAVAAARLPRLPRRRDFRIGVAGAGFIVRDCHLVAYRAAGFHPVAIASRTRASAEAVAQQHGIGRVHDTIDALLADPEVEVLDLALPPDLSVPTILKACDHGHIRGILAQKPLALSTRDARRAVDACRAAGVTLAVNQNMRYDQSVRAMRHLLDAGAMGTPVLATIDMRAIPHWMPWSERLPSLSTFVMSIHHLDTFRLWLGTPDRVLASTRPDPRTTFPHSDGLNLVILEYDCTGARASAWDDLWAGPCREGAAGDIGIRWRVEGTAGVAVGTIGWPSYPQRQPSTLDYTTIEGGVWHRPRWGEVWFPDAFVGTMAQLLCALEDGTEPEIGGADNVETIALCEAVFAAARDRRVVELREFLDGA